ncbi:MAG TPA: aspartate/glutamate racemase family protein [Candidatus Eisenbacteria bacterium]|nr:aspartate/glutamate racemase family protein [Candidatus Eisenbacteria bacterium]
MRLLLLLNGPRERYIGGADTARKIKWSEYCATGTELEIGYLPSAQESGAGARVYAFGTKEALGLGPLYPDRCALAERDGFDAVIIHCFIDPGLRAARGRVRIPVIGPGEVTLSAGASLNAKIGMVTPSHETVESHWEQVRDLGLENRFVGIEPIESPLVPFPQQDPQAMTEALVAAGRKLVDKGAELICPSGLAYIPIRVSAIEVSRRLGVPVLDPALLSVRTAEMMVSALRYR